MKPEVIFVKASNKNSFLHVPGSPAYALETNRKSDTSIFGDTSLGE